MGRHAKVPVDGGGLVRKSKVSTSAETPYRPEDVNWAVLDRLGFDQFPAFADEGARE